MDIKQAKGYLEHDDIYNIKVPIYNYKESRNKRKYLIDNIFRYFIMYNKEYILNYRIHELIDRYGNFTIGYNKWIHTIISYDRYYLEPLKEVNIIFARGMSKKGYITKYLESMI